MMVSPQMGVAFEAARRDWRRPPLSRLQACLDQRTPTRSNKRDNGRTICLLGGSQHLTLDISMICTYDFQGESNRSLTQVGSI